MAGNDNCTSLLLPFDRLSDPANPSTGRTEYNMGEGRARRDNNENFANPNTWNNTTNLGIQNTKTSVSFSGNAVINNDVKKFPSSVGGVLPAGSLALNPSGDSDQTALNLRIPDTTRQVTLRGRTYTVTDRNQPVTDCNVYPPATIDFFARFTTVSQTAQALFSSMYTPGSNSPGVIPETRRHLVLQYNRGGGWSFNILRWNWSFTGQELSPNVWYHFALTLQLAAGKYIFRFYQDGKLVAQSPSVISQTFVPTYFATTRFIIGAEGDQTSGGAQLFKHFHGHIDEFRITQRRVWKSDFTPPTAPHSVGGASATPQSESKVYDTPAIVVQSQRYIAGQYSGQLDFWDTDMSAVQLTLQDAMYRYPVTVYKNHYQNLTNTVRPLEQGVPFTLRNMTYMDVAVENVEMNCSAFSQQASASNSMDLTVANDKDGYILNFFEKGHISKYNYNGELIKQIPSDFNVGDAKIFNDKLYILGATVSPRAYGEGYTSSQRRIYEVDPDTFVRTGNESKDASEDDLYKWAQSFAYDNGKWYILIRARFNEVSGQYTTGTFLYSVLTATSSSDGFPTTDTITSAKVLPAGGSPTFTRIQIGPIAPAVQVQISIPQKDVLGVDNITFTPLDNSSGSPLKYGWPDDGRPEIIPVGTGAKEINDSHVLRGGSISPYLRLPETVQDYDGELNNQNDLAKKTNNAAPAGTGLKTEVGTIKKTGTTAWDAALVLPDIPSGISLEIGSGPTVTIKSVTYVLVARLQESSAYNNTVAVQYDTPAGTSLEYNTFLPYYRLLEATSGTVRFDIYEIVESQLGSGQTYKRIGLNSTTTKNFSVTALPPSEEMIVLRAREYRNDATGKADIYIVPTNNYDETTLDKLKLTRVDYSDGSETVIFNDLPCYPTTGPASSRWMANSFDGGTIYFYDDTFTLDSSSQLPCRIYSRRAPGFHAAATSYYIADSKVDQINASTLRATINVVNYDYTGARIGGATFKNIDTGNYTHPVHAVWVDTSSDSAYVTWFRPTGTRGGYHEIAKYKYSTGILQKKVTTGRTTRGLYFNGTYLYTCGMNESDRSIIVERRDPDTLFTLESASMSGILGTNEPHDIFEMGGDWYFSQYNSGVGKYAILKVPADGDMPSTSTLTSSTTLTEKLGGKFSHNGFVTANTGPCATPWSTNEYNEIVDNNLRNISGNKGVAYKVADVAGIIAEGVAYYIEADEGPGTYLTFEHALNLVRVGLFDPPKAVQGVSAASFIDSSLVITNSVTWNEQTDATEFRVWRTTDGSKPAYGATPSPPTRIIVHDGALSTVTRGGKTFYEIQDTSGLVNAQTYTYTVYPKNAIGIGPKGFAAVVAGDTVAPETVKNISITTSGDATNPDAILTWTNPSDADFNELKILRKEGINATASNDTDGTLVYDNTGISYTDSGLQNGLAYTYTFFASDYVGNQSKISKTIDLVGDTTPPGPVKDLSSQQNDNPDAPRVTLTWLNPDDTDLKTVVIMRRKSKNSEAQPRTIDEAREQGFETVGQIQYR